MPVPTHAVHPVLHLCASRSEGRRPHHEPVGVTEEEVIGGAATPVHHLAVVAAAAQLALPVHEVEVGGDKGVAEAAVTEDGVEERLQERREGQGFRGGALEERGWV